MGGELGPRAMVRDARLAAGEREPLNARVGGGRVGGCGAVGIAGAGAVSSLAGDQGERGTDAGDEGGEKKWKEHGPNTA